jgi:hypothetical protein
LNSMPGASPLGCWNGFEAASARTHTKCGGLETQPGR